MDNSNKWKNYKKKHGYKPRNNKKQFFGHYKKKQNKSKRHESKMEVDYFKEFDECNPNFRKFWMNKDDLEDFFLKVLIPKYDFTHHIKVSHLINNILFKYHDQKAELENIFNSNFRSNRERLSGRLGILGLLNQVTNGKVNMIKFKITALNLLKSFKNLKIDTARSFGNKALKIKDAKFYDKEKYNEIKKQVFKGTDSSNFTFVKNYDYSWIYNDYVADEYERKIKEKTIKRFETFLKEKFHYVEEVLCFGSFKQGFLLKGGDLDLILVINKVPKKYYYKKDYKKNILMDICSYILSTYKDTPEFLMERIILFAKVKILKLFHLPRRFDNKKTSDTGLIKMDLAVMNFIGVRNSELLKEYYTLMNRIDKSLLTFMYMMKIFTKKKGLSDSQNKFMSSFSWYIMAIGFLQHKEFLPSLQELAESNNLSYNEKYVDGFYTNFVTNEVIDEDVVNVCKTNLRNYFSRSNDDGDIGIEIFSLFLNYYSNFEYDKYAINIQYGKPFKRNKEGTTKTDIFVWDPFENRNLTDNAKRNFESIVNTLKNALELCIHSNDIEQKVNEAIKENNPVKAAIVKLFEDHKKNKKIILDYIKEEMEKGELKNVLEWFYGEMSSANYVTQGEFSHFYSDVLYAVVKLLGEDKKNFFIQVFKNTLDDVIKKFKNPIFPSNTIWKLCLLNLLFNIPVIMVSGYYGAGRMHDLIATLVKTALKGENKYNLLLVVVLRIIKDYLQIGERYNQNVACRTIKLFSGQLNSKFNEIIGTVSVYPLTALVPQQLILFDITKCRFSKKKGAFVMEVVKFEDDPFFSKPRKNCKEDEEMEKLRYIGNDIKKYLGIIAPNSVIFFNQIFRKESKQIRETSFYEEHIDVDPEDERYSPYVGEFREVEGDDLAFVKIPKYEDDIMIKGLRHKNRALDNDDVIVKLLNEDELKEAELEEKENEDDDDIKTRLRGKVVSIPKKNSPSLFACTSSKKEFEQFFINNRISALNNKFIDEFRKKVNNPFKFKFMSQEEREKKVRKMGYEKDEKDITEEDYFNELRMEFEQREKENMKKKKVTDKRQNVSLLEKTYLIGEKTFIELRNIITNSRERDTIFFHPIYKKYPRFRVKYVNILNYFRMEGNKSNNNLLTSLSSLIFNIKLTSWKEEEIHPRGAIYGIYGIKRDFFSQIRSVKLQFFPQLGYIDKKKKADLTRANDYDKNISIKRRERLGDITEEGLEKRREGIPKLEETVFTIDPTHSMDLDDAVAVRETTLEGYEGKEIYEIFIVIADIVRYFEMFPAGLKDLYSSLYMGSTVEHLFGRVASEGVFSLLPGVERSAFVVSFIAERESGEIISQPKIERMIINSCCKLTYEIAGQMIEKGEKYFECNDDLIPFPEVFNGEKKEKILKDLLIVNEICIKFKKARFEKTVPVKIDSQKVFYHFNEYGMPDEIVEHCDKFEQQAHDMIEELALICNTSVAEYIAKNDEFNKLFLRIHRTPKRENVQKTMRVVCESTGLKYDYEDNKTRMNEYMNNFLLKLKNIGKNKEEGKYLEEAVRRNMTKRFYKAEYAVFNKKDEEIKKKLENGELEEGNHFGLDYKLYCHFSSPIRRFFDQIVHYQLASLEKHKKRMEGVETKNFVDPENEENVNNVQLQKFEVYEKLIKEVNRQLNNLRKMELKLERLHADHYFFIKYGDKPKITKAVALSLGQRFIRFYVNEFAIELNIYFDSYERVFYDDKEKQIVLMKSADSGSIAIKKFNVVEIAVWYCVDKCEMVGRILFPNGSFPKKVKKKKQKNWKRNKNWRNNNNKKNDHYYGEIKEKTFGEYVILNN